MCGSNHKVELAELLSESGLKFQISGNDPDPSWRFVRRSIRIERILKRKASKVMKLQLLFEAKSWKNAARRACPQVAIRLKRPILSTTPILWRGSSGRPTGSLKMAPGEP